MIGDLGIRPRQVQPIVAASVPGWSERSARLGPYSVGVLSGEGVGPEVVGAAVTVLEAAARAFGVDLHVMRAPEPDSWFAQGRAVRSEMTAFFGTAFAAGAPVICGPVGGRFVYELRSALGLYCKFVPVRPLAALEDASLVRPERTRGVDVLILRENLGGLYQGAYGRRDEGRIAYQEATYHQDQVDALLAVAVRAAAARDGRLAVVSKPGGIPAVSRLWCERAEALVPEGVTIEHLEVDNACYQLVADAHRFDVVAAPNLLGDVLADTAALLLGSRGMALSANFGSPGCAVYQTGHGAAHDLAGRDVANPVAQIHSVAMMLRESLDLPDVAAAIEDAVVATLADGVRTADIAGPSSRIVGTRELAEEVARRVEGPGA